MLAIEIIMELGNCVDNSEPLFFQLRVFLFCRVEGSGNEGDGSLFSAISYVRGQPPGHTETRHTRLSVVCLDRNVRGLSLPVVHSWPTRMPFLEGFPRTIWPVCEVVGTGVPVEMTGWAGIYYNSSQCPGRTEAQ